MKTKHDYLINKLVTAFTFTIMVTVNALANILPINGIGTGGQVSGSCHSGDNSKSFNPCVTDLCVNHGEKIISKKKLILRGRKYKSTTVFMKSFKFAVEHYVTEQNSVLMDDSVICRHCNSKMVCIDETASDAEIKRYKCAACETELIKHIDIAGGLTWHIKDKDLEIIIDRLGGQHDSGCGWTPDGTFCGECSSTTCENCRYV